MDRIHFSAHDLPDGKVGIVASRDSAAELLDGIDGFSAGARYDDVDWGSQFVFATSKKLNSILHAVYATGLVQFLHGDGLCGVQTSLVYPSLYTVQVDFAHIHGEADAHQYTHAALDYNVPLTGSQNPWGQRPPSPASVHH